MFDQLQIPREAATRPRRSTVTVLVVGANRVAGCVQTTRDVFVSTRVLTQTMNDQHQRLLVLGSNRPIEDGQSGTIASNDFRGEGRGEWQARG